MVRLFAVDLSESDLKSFTRRNGTWPLRTALGADVLEAEHVEVFSVSDLSGLGLAGYLEEGMGVSSRELEPFRPQLAALDGAVMVLTSRAFGGTAQTIAPRAPLRLIATFSEDRPDVKFAPLPSASAKGTLAGPGDAGQSQGKRPGSLVLLLISALVLAVIAGILWGLV